MKPNNFSVTLMPDSQPAHTVDTVGLFDIEGDQFMIVSLDQVVPGNLICHFEINGKLYGILSTDKVFSQPDAEITDLLTEREIQIVTFVAFGLSNKQIAQKLDISEWTVSAHLRRTFMKLGVDTRAAMVYRCNSIIDHRVHLSDLHEALPGFTGR